MNHERRRAVFFKKKKNCFVGAENFSVGRFTYGHDRLSIKHGNDDAVLKIGAFCSLAKGVSIFLGGNHRTDWITTFPFGHVYKDELGGSDILGHPSTRGDVIIGNDVWVGYGVTIMSGVVVGDGAVLAANSCVVRDVPSYSIVGGNPAKFIKQRFDDEIVGLLSKLRWWDLPVEDIRNISRTLCAQPSRDRLIELIKIYRGTGVPV